MTGSTWPSSRDRFPQALGGAYCVVGGRSALSIVQEVCTHAAAVIAVGSCAWDGGIAAAAPNPTGAVGVRQAVPGLANLVCLPGCPVNVVNLAATLVHYLTYGALPERNGDGRPNFAYGKEVHEVCERTTTMSRSVRARLGRCRASQRLVPARDGLQRARDQAQLPARSGGTRHELARRQRATPASAARRPTFGIA